MGEEKAVEWVGVVMSNFEKTERSGFVFVFFIFILHFGGYLRRHRSILLFIINTPSLAHTLLLNTLTQTMSTSPATSPISRTDSVHSLAHLTVPKPVAAKRSRKALKVDISESKDCDIKTNFVPCKVCPDHPAPTEKKVRTKSSAKAKSVPGVDDPPTLDNRTIPKMPRLASAPLQLWSTCVKEVAKAMGVKPPIRKGTKEYDAIQALYQQRKPNATQA